MLQTLRERSGSIFIKLLFGILVLSFVLWGVGDVFRHYTSMRPVATIEGSGISQEEFMHTYQRVIHNLQVMSKGKMLPSEMKTMKTYQEVLDNQINLKILKQAIHKMGVVVSDPAMRSHIQSLPVFQNEEGRFDKNKFDLLIKNAGLSESAFIQDIRDSLLQQQLLKSMATGVRLPPFYQNKIFKGLHQQRVFTVVTIPLSKISLSKIPTDADLEQVYKENQVQLTQPEYRKISVLKIDPKEVGEQIQITQAQLQDAYDSRKINFTLPEKRDVTQLVFSSQEKANEASKRLNEGKSIEEVIHQYKGDIRQFEQATPDTFIKDHSSVIFAQSVSSASPALESVLGYVVFVVKKIFPERVQEFDAVRLKLEEDLRKDQANDALYELKNKIEDILAGGAKLTEVAKDYNLALHTLDKVDKKGQNLAKELALSGEFENLILENIFSLTEGTNTPLLEGPNGVAIVVHVDKIIPQTFPELNQIKEKVISIWKEGEQREKAAELARKMTTQVNSTETLSKLAKENGLAIKVLKPVSRADLQKNQHFIDGIPVHVIHQGFVLEAKAATYVSTEKGFDVIMMKKEIPFEEEKDKLDQFKDSIKNSVQQDMQISYIRYLRQNGKIFIDESILKKLGDRG